VRTSGLFDKSFYATSASLMPQITPAMAPTAPKAGLPTVNPTIAPKTPRQMPTMSKAFRVVPLPLEHLFSRYPHEGQFSAELETDFEHSGHSINAIAFFLLCRIVLYIVSL
jgi:hypothetical protein